MEFTKSNAEDNDGEGVAETDNENLRFRKFIILTRWLARYNVIKFILENYKTLQSF